ncbi:MAG: FtsX-like permease family protein, partial [Terriglobales bacterium]
ALAMVLLAGAGLLLQSYARLMAAPRGFSSSTQIASIQFNASYSGFPPPPKLASFYREALAHVRALPGVEAAALAGDVPLNHATMVSTVQIEGQAGSHAVIETHVVSPGYFGAMGIPLLTGRGFTASDLRSDKAVVISAALAKKYFPGESGVGQHMCLCEGTLTAADWPTVVGVVGDVRHYRLDQQPPPQFYTPLGVTSTEASEFVLRSHSPAPLLDSELRSAIRSLDPTLAVGRVQAMGQLVLGASAPQRFRAAVFTAFGVVALLLAALGLYAVLAYGVRQRRAEIGMRMALGAGQGRVMRLVLREGMTNAAAGIAIGIAAALALSRLLGSELYGVRPDNAANLLLAAAVLAVVALAACALPAWRASRMDPLAALREEGQ